MEHTYCILPEGPVLFVKLSGELLMEDVLKVTIEGERLAEARGIDRICVSFKDIRTGLGLRDIHELVRFYEIAGVPTSRRIALVIPESEEWAMDYAFYQVACEGRGYRPRRFTSEASALRWLNAGAAIAEGKSASRG